MLLSIKLNSNLSKARNEHDGDHRAESHDRKGVAQEEGQEAVQLPGRDHEARVLHVRAVSAEEQAVPRQAQEAVDPGVQHKEELHRLLARLHHNNYQHAVKCTSSEYKVLGDHNRLQIVIIMVEVSVAGAEKSEVAQQQAEVDDRGRVPIEELIRAEIQRRVLKQKSWGTLDMCFRWQYIYTFLVEQGIFQTMDSADVALLRQRILQKDLDGVQYDPASKRVTAMDLTCLAK